MDRLTYRFGENNEYANFITKVCGDGWYQYRASMEGALLLADYEDTGLTPEEIAALRARVAELEAENKVTAKAMEDIGKAILVFFPNGSLNLPRNRWIKAIYDLSQAKAGEVNEPIRSD